MEAPAGVRGAAAVRKALNEAAADATVVSLAQVRRSSAVPDALITVAMEPARSVQVVYWDREGRSDVLIAPSPETAEQLHAVVVALSSALIERHVQDTATWARDLLARAPMFEDPRASHLLYAVPGRVGHLMSRSNVRLRYEDF